MNRRAPEICPVCGEDVPPTAKACPHCGASHDCGWGDEAPENSAGVPDSGYGDQEKFDYQGWRAREEGRQRVGGINVVWRVTALLLVVAMFWWLWPWIYRLGTMRWF